METDPDLTSWVSPHLSWHPPLVWVPGLVPLKLSMPQSDWEDCNNRINCRACSEEQACKQQVVSLRCWLVYVHSWGAGSCIKLL